MNRSAARGASSDRPTKRARPTPGQRSSLCPCRRTARRRSAIECASRTEDRCEGAKIRGAKEGAKVRGAKEGATRGAKMRAFERARYDGCDAVRLGPSQLRTFAAPVPSHLPSHHRTLAPRTVTALLVPWIGDS